VDLELEVKLVFIIIKPETRQIAEIDAKKLKFQQDVP